jgi:outer membrane protein assembly factor BamB
LGVYGAEPLPYGHKDFVPTPEKPIYFRAGNGEYPGATPPTEWWEGTPVQRDVKDKNGKVTKIWDFADDKSKNILWKVPVPGWGLSHPIVVGKKVFVVGNPDFVACYDIDTGRQLWQRRIMPLLLDGLPEEKAAAGQKVLDLARALAYVLGNQGKQTPNALLAWRSNMESQIKAQGEAAFVAAKREVARKTAVMAAAHRAEVVGFGDADLVAALDQDVAHLQAVAAAPDLAALTPLLDGNDKTHGPKEALRALCQKKLGVQINGAWQGYVGTADSTLASDGERIYGVFDQGQVFCLDLDGRLLWGHREKGRLDDRGTFHRSPLLCGDLLLVRSRLLKGRYLPISALDTRTGETRWQTTVPHPNYTVSRLMRLPGLDGKPMDVLIGDAPVDKAKNLGLPILRVSDGKVIGHTPWHDCGRGAVMGIRGDMAIWTSTSDTAGGPTCCYRLKVVNADAVSAEKVYVLGETDKAARIFYSQGEFPTMLGDLWFYDKERSRIKLYDTTTGREASSAIGKGTEAQSDPGSVMAGRHLIALGDSGGGRSGGNSAWDRPRDDRKAMVRFVVVDLTDLSKPRVLSNRNLLGYKDPPADFILRDYLSAFDPIDFCGMNHASASYFSMMGGPVPHGSRLLIQSSAYLYCIGEK